MEVPCILFAGMPVTFYRVGKKVYVPIIVSVLISAVIAFIISQINKNQNAMNIVRQYADKRIKEFDQYFKKQYDNLELLNTDLVAKDSEAKAAVKRLDLQIERFDDVMNRLKEPIDQVNALTAQADSYDRSLQELMNMTAAMIISPLR